MLCITKSDQYQCCSFTMNSRAGKMDQGNALISQVIDEMAGSNICFLLWTLSYLFKQFIRISHLKLFCKSLSF